MSNKPRKKKTPRNSLSKRSGDQGNRQDAMGTQLTTQESFSGPIPSPDVLFQYDQHMPGLANRIVSMAEAEAAHRHSIESTMLAGDISLKQSAYAERRLGQIFGFLLSLTAIGGGIFLAINGVAGWGTVLSLTGVAALAGVFVLGRKHDQK